MLAFHVLLEGDSIDMQSDVERWMPCPLFAQIARTIAVDEARHVAFGKIWLPMRLRGMSDEEHAEMYLWLKGLWFDVVGNVVKRLRPFDFVNGPKPWHTWMLEEWVRRADRLRNVGLRFEDAEAVRVAE